ncbi:MAG: endonuclease III [Syntrophales bacterium]|jgi:endonuclease-3|nr:endonuclease III [Syntrophales bacterium]MCK9527065.1 endonuclease III [Syntrophales bacterium]MDX9921810.1 endonuclease III [Syntrophales bacterium]
MKDQDIARVIALIKGAVKTERLPMIAAGRRTSPDPYRILISTLLSLRTKDEVTRRADERLFELASTPEEMVRLSEDVIRAAIYPVGFYRRKAQTIISVSRELIDRFSSRVPSDIDELLSLKGVGRKTANLVVSMGYGRPALCVDTHVHRVSNRLGYVAAANPDATEAALRKKLPRRYWIDFNGLIIAFGKSICRPVSPLCSSCPVRDYCDRVGVRISR